MLTFCAAQEASLFIDDIRITGNKHTRDFVIEKEIDLRAGEAIGPEELEKIEERLLNTGLFSHVNVQLTQDHFNRNVLQVQVREGWYVFPSPSVDFADRDFSSWVNEGKMSLDRLNFGLRFYHINLTGRGDYLKAQAEFGHQRKYKLHYKLPYINAGRTLGLIVNMSYVENREVAYTTIRDELQFLSTGSNDLLSKLSAGLRATYRPGIYSVHSFGVTFNRLGVADSIAALNPRFFDQNSTGLKFMTVNYTFENDLRNRRPISHSGHFLRISLSKEGLGIFNEINLGKVELEFEKYFPVAKRLTAYISPKARFCFIRNAPPYYLNSALGEGGRHIRGYDDYAINGMDYVHASGGLRMLCLDEQIQFGSLMPLKKLRQMSLKVYMAGNIDAGKVWDPNFGQLNTLDNQLLFGFGPAVHFLLYETFHLSVEYNFNHLYESGLYLQSEFKL